MRFEELIEALGRQINVPLTVDADGACVISVDDLTVTLQNVSEADSVGLWGAIGEPPPQGIEKLLSAMLEANHMFAGTGGATISRDPANGRFFLCRLMDVRCLDAETFATALERFVNTLESWVAMVRDYRETASDAKPAEPEAAPRFGNSGFLAV